MKKIAVALLIGAVLGGSVVMSLYYIAPREDGQRAIETLDFLFEEWSAQRETVDTVAIAQIPARIELPDAKPGYFPDTVKQLAARIERLYRIPRGVTLAQWALESAWGKSNLGVSNYFGHTHAAVKPFLTDRSKFVVRREKTMDGKTIVPGKAVRFALYKNISECFDVHGQYISRSSRYARAFKAESSAQFARAIGKAGYAEDPDYSLKLIAIMKRYGL